MAENDKTGPAEHSQYYILSIYCCQTIEKDNFSMSISDTTPILIGVADFKQTVPDDINTAMSPVELAAQVSKLALSDAGISPNEITDLVVVRTSTDSLPMTPPPFGSSDKPPASVAKRIGAHPRYLVHSSSGGNTPQQLVNEWAETLAQTDQSERVVLLTGAEALASVKAAIKTGHLFDWREQTEELPSGANYQDQGMGITDMLALDDMRHGMSKPTTQYAIAENARRASLGHTYQQHAFAMGQLFAPFSEVAAANKYSMFPAAYSAQQIAEPNEKNGYVDFPYTFRMIAKDSVNQAAAVIMTTVGRAKELSVDESKWVYLHAYAQAKDLPILKREKLGESKALHLTYQQALANSGLSIDDISVIDLYSCFPIVVELAKQALGIDDDRAVTQTGGLPFFGGPGNNYSMHGITAVVRKLRSEPTQYGLVGANGGMINKHAVGIYSRQPGWRYCDSSAIQNEAYQQHAPSMDSAPQGKANIETYTVTFSKGQPVHAVVIGRLQHSGARFVSCNIRGDTNVLTRLLSEDCIGAEISVLPTAKANLMAFDSDSLVAISPPMESEFRNDYEYCEVVINDSVLEVTINRPESHNALHPPANDELAAVFDLYMRRDDLRVAIITGAGDKAFCSGNDLKYSASGKPYWTPLSGFAGLTSRVGRNKPVIAAVNGVAMGGGFEIALASDLIVAAEQAKFGLPEVKRGLIAAAGGIVRLPRQMPEKLAMEIMLTGEPITAARAAELGVVNHVVSAGKALTKARELAKVIAANSPTSIKLTMDLRAETANQGDPNIAAGGIPEVLDRLVTSEDFYEGPKAFAEKRAPKWTGR